LWEGLAREASRLYRAKAVAVMSAPACIDICAIDDESKYLIFEDCRFVKIRSLKDKLPVDPDSWPKLHECCCQDGDHYIGYKWSKSLTSDVSSSRERELQEIYKFYIIFRDYEYNLKEVQWRHGLGLEPGATDEQGQQSCTSTMTKLNYRYRGGDFYLSKGSEFYVIFKKNNSFLRTMNLSKDPAAKKTYIELHEELRNGVYYFASANFIYVVIADADNSFVYRRTPDLQTVEDGAVRVDPSVAKVLRNGVQLQRCPWKSHGMPCTHVATVLKGKRAKPLIFHYNYGHNF
jgi:hypothetical protein